ncbi:MAG: hypothetical protein JXR71_00555 [Bacteroidales bacterium]|nr:hypothetical protein [Bacteroidales bacterium]
MKRHIFLLAVALFFSVFTYGQTANDNQFKSEHTTSGMYIHAGPSFPLFDLSKNNPYDSSAGMAATGFHVELGYSHQVTNNLGYKISSFYFGNKYSEKKYSNYFAGILGGGSSIANADGWSVGGFLVKPYFYVPITENITWEVYASAGFSAFYTPKYTRVSHATLPDTTVYYYYRDKSKGISFAYGLGTQLNFKMFNTNLMVSADFLSIPIKYTATGIDINNQSYSESIKSKLGYLSVNIGYIIYFK